MGGPGTAISHNRPRPTPPVGTDWSGSKVEPGGALARRRGPRRRARPRLPNRGGQGLTSDRGGPRARERSSEADGVCPTEGSPGVRKLRGRGRLSVLIALALAVAGAATIGLTPVIAGEQDDADRVHRRPRGRRGFVDSTARPTSPPRTCAATSAALARCATPGYRAAYPSRCPALSPTLARAERAPARALRAGPRTAGAPVCSAPRPRCSRSNRALKRAFAVSEPPRRSGPGPSCRSPRPADQLDPAPHGQGPLVRLPGEARLRPDYPEPERGPGRRDVELGRGLRLRPGHRHQRAARPAERPAHGQALQHLVRRPDPAARRPRARGRRQPALLRNGDPKYKGHCVVLTFNPFNETWTVQPRMRHGRWYPTLTELADGRVVIVAGLDEEPERRRRQQPRHRGLHAVAEPRTASARSSKVGRAGLRPLPARVPQPGRQAHRHGPRRERHRHHRPGQLGRHADTQDLPALGAPGRPARVGGGDPAALGPGRARRTILMTGGSPAEDAPHYDNAPATNTSLSSTSLNGAIIRRRRPTSARAAT